MLDAINRFQEWLFLRLPAEVMVGLFFLLGLGVGVVLHRWIAAMVAEFVIPLEAAESQAEADPPSAGQPATVGEPQPDRLVREAGDGGLHFVLPPHWRIGVPLVTGCLFAAFCFFAARLECQVTPEVIPDAPWRLGRIWYHLVLLSLLIAATGTDLREYLIPDRITFPGMLIGLVAGFLAGQLWMIQLWVDWTAVIPGMKGPEFPEWLDRWRHCHGLSVSIAGLAVGGGITWMVRATSSWILKQEALGLGDVTLMMMIGSFLGWQPTLFVFLLAPLCALVFGLVVRLLTSRPFVPYGPYLSIAAVIVLFSWRWIWMLEIPWGFSQPFLLRNLLGDWQALAMLSGSAYGALLLLLGLLRLYRLIPGKRRDG